MCYTVLGTRSRKEGAEMDSKKTFGYARVSTRHQHEDRQVKALSEYGIRQEDIYVDKVSGLKEHRPALDKLLSLLQEGDTVVVSSFDRLARSTKQLLELAERFQKEGVRLVSMKENLDTSTPQGKLFFTISAAFAEFERSLIEERREEGTEIARERGVKFGRPESSEDKIEAAISLYLDGKLSVDSIAKTCGVSRATIYNKLKARGISRDRK